MRLIQNIKIIKIVYLIVFLSLAFWSVFAYKTINELIDEQKIYATLINITGKQRMLSQKTTLFVKRSFENNDKKIDEHLTSLIKLMKSDYQFILANLTTNKIKDIYFKEPYNLDIKIRDYFFLLDSFIKNKDIAYIKKIEESSFSLLPILNYAVYAFEKEINEKTEDLQKREFYILIGALITLILEAIFIVIPSVKSTEKSLKILENNNIVLESKVQEKLKDIKEKEEILYHQSKMLTLNKLLDNIAHYWRQPLSIITTSATGILVKKEFDQLTNKELEDALNNIVDNSIYLSNIIEKYKTLFELKKEKNSFTMKNLYEKSTNIISNKTLEKNIILVEEIDNIDFNGYENDLIQVLVYIYENAIDVFEERNIKNKYIFTKIKKEEDKIVISIKDSAGGIHKNIMDKIFEPYFTTKNKKEGTGIDLYISKQLLKDRFGGEIKVSNVDFSYEDKKLSGAKFDIFLLLR